MSAKVARHDDCIFIAFSLEGSSGRMDALATFPQQNRYQLCNSARYHSQCVFTLRCDVWLIHSQHEPRSVARDLWLSLKYGKTTCRKRRAPLVTLDGLSVTYPRMVSHCPSIVNIHMLFTSLYKESVDTNTWIRARHYQRASLSLHIGQPSR